MTLQVEAPRDPLVPRPIDLPTAVPLDPGADLAALDGAKILAAPDDPADWPAWREALARWRAEAAARIGYDGSAYERLAWTQRCFSVALVWLWDERLYDHAAGRFTPERLLAEAEREFGGFDGIVLWHAYPVIGIDERNQFDWYRDVPGSAELVADLRGRGIRVFLDYNPWDVGTRREPVGDEEALGLLVRELGADGLFLDTMKEARPELTRGARPGRGARGRVDGAARAHRRPPALVGAVVRRQPRAGRAAREVVRAAAHAPPHAALEPQPPRGAAQRVAERRRDARVGLRLRRVGRLERARPRRCCAAMTGVQRRYAELLATGEWTPLAASSPDTRVVASRWSDGETTLWALANRGEAYAGPVGELEVELPAGGIAAFVGSECVMVAGGGDAAFPAREAVRVPAPVVARRRGAGRLRRGAAAPPRVTATFRVRETGAYGEAPFVEEWKPLPPRLHDVRRGASATRSRRRGSRSRGSRCRGRRRAAHGADAGRGARCTRPPRARACRPRTSGSSPPRRACSSAAARSSGTGRRASTPTASRASRSSRAAPTGRRRARTGTSTAASRSPAFSLKLLLAGPLQASSRIGFRLAVDLP